MSDWDGKSPAVEFRFSTNWIVLLSMTVVFVSILLVAPVLGGFGQAVTTVGYVLAEALVLYVGYGALARITSPVARELLVST